MKRLGLILLWTVLLGSTFFYGPSSWVPADPSDDFSLTLPSEGSADAHLLLSQYRMLSEEGVARIFRDRLSLFPLSKTPALARHLLDLCRKYRFDPAFILALIHVESHFKVHAVSPVGALGLMQIMPATAVHVWKNLGLKPLTAATSISRVVEDPFVNLTLGVAYLAELRDRYEGLPAYYLVTAYNMGPGKLDELLSRPTFKPVKSRLYYQEIRKHLPSFLAYRDSGFAKHLPFIRGRVCKVDAEPESI